MVAFGGENQAVIVPELSDSFRRYRKELFRERFGYGKTLAARGTQNRS
jgi:hypothetical protein